MARLFTFSPLLTNFQVFSRVCNVHTYSHSTASCLSFKEPAIQMHLAMLTRVSRRSIVTYCRSDMAVICVIGRF